VKCTGLMSQKGEAAMVLVSTTQAGRILGLSAERVRQLERSGLLVAIRTESGQRLFSKAHLLRVAARRRPGPSTAAVGRGPAEVFSQ